MKALHMRVIGVLYCAVLLASLTPHFYTYAANPLQLPGIISASQFDDGGEGVGHSAGFSPMRNTAVIGINAPQWLRYTVSVEKDGLYKAAVQYASLNGSSTMEISVDGVAEFTADLLTTGSWTEKTQLELGSVHLTKGTHVLEVKMTIKGVSFYQLSFSYFDPNARVIDFASKTGAYRNHFLPCVIQAEDFDRDAYASSDGKNDGGKYRTGDGIDIYETGDIRYVLLNSGEYVSYTLRVLQAGAYSLRFRAKGTAAVVLTLNNLPGALFCSLDGSPNDYQSHTITSVYLPPGTYALKVAVKSSLFNLDYIRFARSDEYAYEIEDLEKPFTYDLSAQETDENRKIFKQLYVSERGSDEASGDEDSPFLTLARAKTEVAKLHDDIDGDIIVNILPGYYELAEAEVFTNVHGGKDGFRVVYKGVDAFSPPIFSGGVKVDGWTKHNEFIWKAPLSGVTTVRNLYVNGFAAKRAASKYIYKAEEAYFAENGREDGVLLPEENFPESLSNVEDIELVWNEDWKSSITAVKNIIRKDGVVAIVMDQPYYSQIAAQAKTDIRAPRPGNGFYIENAPELLDEPGEFYYDKKEQTVYYYPFTEETLTDVYVGKTEGLISVEGETPDNPVNGIAFNNLEFRYGAWNQPSETGMLAFQADSIYISGENRAMHAQFSVNCAKNAEIKNCRFGSLGSAALSLSNAVFDSKVTGNLIRDCSATAISLGSFNHSDDMAEGQALCRNIAVTDNVIRRVGTEYRSSAAIAEYYANSTEISHNDIKDVPYTGISIGWGWGAANVRSCGDNIIAYNHVEKVMGTLHDGSHIYTLGSNRNTKIHDNYLIDTADYRGGIYTDNGSAYIEYYRNVITGAKHWWFTYSPDMTELYSHDNFSDTETYTNNIPGKVVLENNLAVTDGNWSEEALNIMANAGVRSMYHRFVTQAESPAWRTDFIRSFPNERYIPAQERTWVQAEDYTDGNDYLVLYGNSLNYTVGDTQDGSYLTYEATLEQSGDYELEIVYSNAFAASTPQTLVDIYVDGQKVISQARAPRTDSWADYTTVSIGSVHLESGMHEVKFVLVENGLSFDKWRFVSDAITISDEFLYDDAQDFISKK